MKDNMKRFPIEKMSKVLKVSRSGYYGWLNDSPSVRTVQNNNLKAHPQVQQSMSRKGNCWDNAVAESFFKTLKSECTDRQKFNTRKEAEMAIFQYIETWYNTRRRHSSLNYMTPMKYSQLLQTRKIAA